MKHFKIILLLTIFVIHFYPSAAANRKKRPLMPNYVPAHVWKASNFITEYHRKKFVEGVFRKISQPYLTSVTDEDIPDMNVVNALASVISNELMEKHRADEAKNATNSSTTQPVPEPEDASSQKYIANCEKYDYIGSPTVEIVNLTRFDEILSPKQNITSRHVAAPCVLALFYAHTCPFSAMVAPHFNALARAFPSIKMIAINTKKHQIINSQFGIVGIPTVMLFHNGRPLLKFNRHQYTLAHFTRFITIYTGIAPDPKLFVASTDFGGPLPGVPKQETDYNLPLSWAVIGIWFLKYMLESRWFSSFSIPFYGRLGDAAQ